MAPFLVCTGRNVLLPGNAAPVPATITIDILTGKITDIVPEYQTRDAETDDDSVQWIDAADKVVLPGLVECVYELWSLDDEH